MKLLLTAINSKYIHSNLAVYSLKAYADNVLASVSGGRDDGKHCDGNYAYDKDAVPEIEIAEYTINQPPQKILSDIYRKKPDVLFFSCYIWNRQEIMQLAADIAKVRSDIDIWLGGPEVSFDAEKLLEEQRHIKGVICGEGEEPFARLAKIYAKLSYGCEYDGSECDAGSHCEADIDTALCEIPGLSFRNYDGRIVCVPQSERMDLDSVPFAYKEAGGFENRIIYYESSRGCPFRCSYCLSSVEKKLRFRNTELVKRELKYFLDNNVPQVKFIDRTFNCGHEHAMEIWRFLKENDNGVTNFHFEIAADLITDEELELLAELRCGQVQFEIGVQSTNETTLSEINRPMNFAKVTEVVRRIKAAENIHLHLDLIAGLPFEDMESFEKSFNDVFSLRPEQLQLGFLKVLRGSPMEAHREGYGLKYMQMPPYEVLETKWISYDELIGLKMAEEMLDVYYNSGQFVRSLELLLECFESPFRLFAELAQWYELRGIVMLNLSRNSRFEELLEFGKQYVSVTSGRGIDMEEFLDALIYDYYARENVKTRPEFLGQERVEKEYAKEFYSIESREHRVLTSDACAVDDPRVLRKLTHLEKLGGRYYLFDYTRRNPMTANALVAELDADL